MTKAKKYGMPIDKNNKVWYIKSGEEYPLSRALS
jgi:hypothetical protein